MSFREILFGLGKVKTGAEARNSGLSDPGIGLYRE